MFSRLTVRPKRPPKGLSVIAVLICGSMDTQALFGGQRSPELSLDQERLPHRRGEGRSSHDGGDAGPARHAPLIRLVLWALSVGLGVLGFVLLEQKFKRPANTCAGIDYAIIGLLLVSGSLFVLPLTPVVFGLAEIVRTIVSAVRTVLPI